VVMPEEEKQMPVDAGPAHGAASIEIVPFSPSRGSWLPVLVGINVVAAAAVLLGALLVQFLNNRPLNLRFHTNYWADQLTEALEEYVTPDLIRRSPPQLLHNEAASWHLYRFDVDLPAHLSAGGIEELIGREMIEEGINVDSRPAGPDAKEMRLALGGQDFAVVAFHKARRKAIPRKTDLRAACYRIARELAARLVRAGMPAGGVTLGEAIEREDDETLWTLTPVEAIMPEGLTTGELTGRLEEQMSESSVLVRSARSAQGPVVRLAYAGRDCVEIVCVQAADQPPVAMADTSSADTLAKKDINDLLSIRVPPLHELPLDSVEQAEGESGGLAVEEGEAVPPGPRAVRQVPRIAIILDDGGYASPDLDTVLRLDPALTLAILPNTPLASETAERAAAGGFEVILHMPMETHSKTVKAFPGELTTDMDADQIREQTEEAIAQIPGIVGANNHTGSKFTSDAERIPVFLQVLKEHGLYFADSRTIPTTQAYDAAVALGVPAIQRNVFLDNQSDPEQIRGQLGKLVDIAKRRGQAVGIGHFRKATVAVLAEELPKLQADGVELVHASELMQ